MWHEVHPEYKGKVIQGIYQWGTDGRNEYFLLTCEPESDPQALLQLMITVPKVDIRNCANCEYATYPMLNICRDCHFISNQNNMTHWKPVSITVDLLKFIEDKYGPVPGETISDKVSWLKKNITVTTK